MGDSRWLALAALVAGCVAHCAQAASFTIDDWSLGVGISQSEVSGASETVGGGFGDPINPFLTSHWGALGNSTVSASYDVAWAEQFATFMVQSTHEAEGKPSTTVSAHNFSAIWVTPSEDVTLAIDAQWTYNLPVDWMRVQLWLLVADADGPDILLHRSLGDATFPGEPVSGVLTVDDQITLPAGRTWILDYYIESWTTDCPQGYAATGNGYFSFQITPEPTAVCLLVLVGLLLRRHRPRRVIP